MSRKKDVQSESSFLLYKRQQKSSQLQQNTGRIYTGVIWQQTQTPTNETRLEQVKLKSSELRE